MSRRVVVVQKDFKQNGGLSDDNITFLFDTIKRLEGALSVSQKKLTSCRNLSTQKDAMIAKRDRSIAKAHMYIETLKDQLRDARESTRERSDA